MITIKNKIMRIKQVVRETKEVEIEIELPYYFTDELQLGKYKVCEDGKLLRVYVSQTYAAISVNDANQEGKQISSGKEISKDEFDLAYGEGLRLLGLYTDLKEELKAA